MQARHSTTAEICNITAGAAKDLAWRIADTLLNQSYERKFKRLIKSTKSEPTSKRRRQVTLPKVSMQYLPE